MVSPVSLSATPESRLKRLTTLLNMRLTRCWRVGDPEFVDKWLLLRNRESEMIPGEAVPSPNSCFSPIMDRRASPGSGPSDETLRESLPAFVIPIDHRFFCSFCRGDRFVTVASVLAKRNMVERCETAVCAAAIVEVEVEIRQSIVAGYGWKRQVK
jgi:hypothetical protein